MAIWIEHDPDVVLRLILGDVGAQFLGVGHRQVETPDFDVQVHHGSLAKAKGGPDRSDVLFRELEDDEDGFLGGGFTTEVPGSSCTTGHPSSFE